MMFFDENSLVWLTGFWGFSPEENGTLGFTEELDRTRFISMSTNSRRLVCIYGASSPQTNPHFVHQLLGVIEVECIPIDAFSKMSDAEQALFKRAGWENKWRYAMPVRRAWRTNHTLSVRSVFPKSYKPSSGRYIARFGCWLEPEEARLLLTKVPFREVSVFGEASLPKIESPVLEQSLDTFLKPSRGIFGAFGDRSYTVVDRPNYLYLAHFPIGADHIIGISLGRNMGLFKIGISGDLKKRLVALNLSFPEKSLLGWKIIRTAKFLDRESAGNAETSFKTLAMAIPNTRSLGREFFLMNNQQADELFNRLSPAIGLEIRR